MKVKRYFGLTLIVLGFILLFTNKKLIRFGWAGFWPVFFVVSGVLLIYEYMESREKGCLFPGILLAGTGIFLLFLTL